MSTSTALKIFNWFKNSFLLTDDSEFHKLGPQDEEINAKKISSGFLLRNIF